MSGVRKIYLTATALSRGADGKLFHNSRSVLYNKLFCHESSITDNSTLRLKKRPNFETVSLEIKWINFDGIWQKYSKVSRIEFACFSFHTGLLFFINFSSFNPDTENNANSDSVSSKLGNFDAAQ